MRAIAVVGFKNSGKTTLAVELARVLSERGLRVAGAKFSHHKLERADVDTGRLAEVCETVIGLSPEETMLLWPERRYLPDLLPLANAEALVVEGGKSLAWLPRVLVLRDAAEAEELSPELALGTFGPVTAPGLKAFGSVEELAEAILARGFALPGLDCGACDRASCRELAVDMVAGTAEAKACASTGGEFTVSVGGTEMALNPFVARIIRGALMGILAELKGYAPGQSVTITLKDDAP